MRSRLTTERLIEYFSPPASMAGHQARRRYYRLTPFGRQVGRAETVLRYARKHKQLPSGGSR